LLGENLVERAALALGEERGELVCGVECDRHADQRLDADVVAAFDPQNGISRNAGALGERVPQPIA
jgi:hypothetical protein